MWTVNVTLYVGLLHRGHNKHGRLAGQMRSKNSHNTTRLAAAEDGRLN